MKKLILALFFFSILSSLQAQNKQWTLKECVMYALKNNISIKQSELDLEASKIDKSDAIGNYLPSLNGQASNTWNTGLTQNVTTGVLEQQTTRNFSLGVTASVDLFNGLKNLKQLQRAKLSQLASTYSLEKMKDDIVLFVANSYLDVLVNKETLKVLQQQNQVTQEQYRRTQDLVDAGTLPEGDLLEIEATNADEQQQIIAAENAVKISLISLAQTLLIKDYEHFDIVDESFSVSLNDILNKTPQEIIEAAKKERYEIKIAEENVALAKKDVEISRSSYYPTLSGFVNYNTRESGANRYQNGTILPPRPFFDQLSLNDGVSYGFQLNVPILNGFSSRNAVKRSKINVQRSEYQLEQAKLDLESNIYQAYVDAQGAAKSYQAAQKAVTSQEKAYDYAKERYDVGLTNAFDFSQSKFRLSDSKSRLVQAKYNYIFKLKVLELYFGVDPENIKL